MNVAIKQFLENGIQQGGFNNDDVVAILVPLFERIASFHEEGNVANDNFINQISIEDDVLYLPKNAFAKTKINYPFLTELKQNDYSSNLEIVEEYNEETVIGEHVSTKIESHFLEKELNKDENKRAYLVNFKSYEIAAQHHDAVTDIFLLGLLLASFAMNIDVSEKEKLNTFIEYQKNPSAFNANIHPTIAAIITSMTELNRHNRAQDLREIIERLENYRAFNLELQQDLSDIVENKTNRHEPLLLKLRSRLFDLTRRNRMLYYKPSMKLLNLTYASFPMVLNLKYVRPDSLMIWNEKLQELVRKQKNIALAKFIRFEDNPYVNSSLNKIRLEANRDIKEYGFSELKLAGVFLHWFNFKENPDEAISSPLLLIPIKLVKKKGVKDNFTMEINDSVAEINPVLQFQLKELYNIDLPDKIDFETEDIRELYDSLKLQIEAQQSNVYLEYVDKPKIKVIHSKARQILNQYKRKQKNNKQLLNHLDLEYSYTDEMFKPLGLEMYKNYVEGQISSLEFLTGDYTNKTSKNFQNEINKKAYSIEEASKNKYTWQFDLCHVVLGNFNYKKMTLVRDYNEIINQQIESPLFNALFNNEVKDVPKKQSNEYKISDLYNVVESDPSQDLAIVNARANNSYLIQGPPGTGKSQTITNLIADFVARGKKVLFVCEKRAALDVVYQRLEQQKLEELCCLIHDSQTDKKAFVQDLKKIYESNLEQTLDFQLLEKERNNLVDNIQKELQNIDIFHEHMLQNGIDCDTSIRELLNEILKLKNYIPSAINQQNFESLPSYKNWENYGSKINQLYEILEKQNFTSSFSEHHISLYNKAALKSNIPLSELQEKINKILNLAEECEERLGMLYFSDGMQNDLEILHQSALDLSSLFYFSNHNLSNLLDSKSTEFRTLLQEQKDIEIAKKELEKAALKNKHWKSKLTPQDCLTALEITKAKEGSFFSFFSGDYRSVKKSINLAYDFDAHQIKPKYTQVLLLLNEEYKAEENFIKLKKKLTEKYHNVELNSLLTTCEKWHSDNENETLIWFDKNKEKLNILDDAKIFVERLFQLDIEANIVDWKINPDFISLQNKVNLLSKNLHDYAYFLPYLLELYQDENEAVELLKNEKWKAKEIEAALVFKSLQSYLSQHRDLMHITSETIQFYTQKLKTFLDSFRQCNALYIKAKQNQNFNEKIRLSELSVTGLNDQEKADKTSYLEGRKILENEFGKSMRYKSIRVLASAESGNIIRELKPIWLMSPLSVSDTLPIETNFFDVVIYDEASQITLEEGMPPLFRAPQTIIVGDKMQMPPSNFFNKKTEEEDDDEELLMEQVDSLLDQGSRKLPSVMLQWHYRSRHETLIGYSNAAFYENKLLTIPDVYDLKQEFEPIEIRSETDAAFKYQDVFKRPISYHHIKNGLYQNRTNENEAKYIAELVKHLLLSHSKLSVGIVAFSKEQQREIEEALNNMRYFEKGFEELFDDKLKRYPDYDDIFIKNLENVQGDERDIIIMSTCYGYNKQDKMLMNFGPINRKGGEKRLNVIFSRAKKHMVVVSSIKHEDITNEYNEGANYFKKYLQFAEQMSLGKTDNGLRILNSLHWQKDSVSAIENPLAKEIASAINALGFYAEINLGQSDFKCHVAIKNKKENKNFDLGIIIDDQEHYANEHIHASYLLKPNILKVFGWQVMPIFAKDWYENKQNIINKIAAHLKGEAAPLIEESTLTELQKNFDEDSYLRKKDNYQFTRLEMHEGNAKFWEVAMNNQDLIIQYGRIGSDGQKLIKNYESHAAAIDERRKLIEQKLRRGYVRA